MLQSLLASIPLDGLDADVSNAKQEMVVFSPNRSTYILIHSRKVLAWANYTGNNARQVKFTLAWSENTHEALY